MINRLSGKYQREIALSLISVFLISGIASAKAAAAIKNIPCFYSNASILSATTGSTGITADTRRTANSNMVTAEKNIPGNVALRKPATAVALKTEKSNLHTIHLPAEEKKAPLIGGPGQPEMSSFKPVGADNMVSSFTGDFSYNIPLLDVGGYPVNMFYGSGITMDQDASWVGLGWNINPGTINRNMRGLPDDFNGTDLITKRQSVRPDKTWGVTGGAGIKFAGFPLSSIGIDISLGLSFNNKLGVAAESGIHPSLSISSKNADSKTSGLSYGATVGASLNLNSRNGASLTPSISFDATKHDGDVGYQASLGGSYTYSSRLGMQGMHLDAGLSKSDKNVYEHFNNEGESTGKESASGSMGSLSSSLSFLYPTVVPSIRNIYTRRSYNLSFSVGGEVYGLNGHARIAGFYTENKIAEEDKVTTHPAYGILHYEDANNNPKAMLDFNRLNDGVYTPSSPAIALPMYTYDVFSISGEGTGGSFRAYRSDIGFMRDPNVRTKESSGALGLDIGFGNTIHGGAEFSYANSPNEVSAWTVNNAAAGVLKFKNNNGSYRAAYFKNPGEKSVPDAAFQNTVGGEDLVRFKMGNIASGTPILLPSLVKYDATLNRTGELGLNAGNVYKAARDKRTQVISFLTGEEAARIGFDKKIFSYSPDAERVLFSAGCNRFGVDSINRTNINNGGTILNPNYAYTDSYRQPHHISEIDVLGTDGRKYVYGLPVYNTRQVDVSFAIENGSTATGKSTYVPGTDDGNGNKKGRDWYMQQEETPAYTHSFLLTELVSPNYVDVTGNGISEDDMGDAVKFNYSKFNQGYKWRTPVGYGTATYSEGLKTDLKDDKAHYTYGEREMWLLYSIESKNMVARFYAKNDRKDCRQVLGQAGGLDQANGMQRLDKISLYSKGDLIKYGTVAKPIKTVKFFQSYKLCPGVESSIAGYGKLTLDSIWITYNGNSKKAKSRYIFSYPADKNPSYDYNSNDRWGNYKPASENPAGLTNADYPYNVQDKTKADKYAAAWTMNKIVLPSGGVINIDYESDDYAYVQNKKAAGMYRILGFGTNTAPNLGSAEINRIYTGNNGSVDNDYVYIQLPDAVAGANATEKQKELAARYFENTTQLYMKLAVIMPSGNNIPGPAGPETIPVYADIDGFGLVNPSGAANIAWVHVRKVAGNTTPMTQQALQFLKQQLPGKAYKGYDLSENSGMKAVVLALAGMVSSLGALLTGDDNALRRDSKCRETVTEKSFARLTNPFMQKEGGGLRVKRVVINDNWNKMTGQYESSYGQEYKYTTTELVNNKLSTISSGVAAWEPSVGGDENPHKEIMRFMNHNKGGPYDFGAIDMPLGEAFYPTPMVGYSRVEVMSITRDTVKNLPTRQVTEFYTTKDFPFKSSATQLTDPEANVKYEPSAIKQLLHLDMQKAITQSQGFLVDMNDMNGKEKLKATYSALDSVNPVSYSQNYYNIEKATDNTYKFNHNFKTITSSTGQVSNSLIGRDIEVMADFRQHTSEMITTNIHANFDFFFLGIFPVPLTNLLQPTIYEGTTYRSASLLKIVNHYGMLDSVVVVDKGSMVSTKNLVYDAETGNPLLTRTNNEHNKPVYNFSYPAHWAYSGMGGAYKNIDAEYSGLNFSHGVLTNMPADMYNVLESGDELYALVQNNLPIDRVTPCDNNAGTDPWTTLAQNTEKKIWAVNTSKAGGSNPQWIFMDRDGNPYNAKGAYVRIIRSGHRNLLDQTAGSVTSMSDPGSTGQIAFADATNIIQTGAATFKDFWRVDNAFFKKDSSVTYYVKARVKRADIYPQDYVSVRENGAVDRGNYIEMYKHLRPYSNAWIGGYHSINERELAFLLYDLSQSGVPAGANLYKATMSLYSHTNTTFPANGYFPSANHPNLHNPAGSQTLALTGEIASLRNNWFSTNNGSNWVNYYFNNNFVSPGRAIIPATWNASENYINGQAVDVTVPFQQNAGSVLAAQNKVAFRLRLGSDDVQPGNRHPAEFWNHRCFWSPGAKTIGKAYPFASPTLAYYYYVCGDTASSYYNGDPIVNTMVTCYSVTVPATFCLSKFTQRKSVNPYAEGIWGNWRMDSTYAYYGDRKETDPNTAVDTRTGGTIAGFKKFWNFSGSPAQFMTRNNAANDVWVWNSTITQFNRKGYEIENKDPLGRFNSGLYGYNQQLPIAVANNARVREILFDGFEDYDYNTSLNCLTCKPHRSFNYNADIAPNLDGTQTHTGNKSLRINAGQSISITAPVTDAGVADKGYSVRIRRDSTQFTTTTVTGHGSGLEGTYFYHRDLSDPRYTRIDPIVNFNWGGGGPGAIGNNNYSIRWRGYIQPKYSGVYTIKTVSDDGTRIYINGTLIMDGWYDHSLAWNQGTYAMTAGQAYSIEVQYYERSGDAAIGLFWESANQPLQVIPTSQMYPPGHLGDLNGTVVTQTIWCSRLDSVNVRNNALTDTFSLLQGKKMLLSAWVREGGNDCKCSSYVKNNIVVSYSGGSQEPTMYPSGSIIEGWQRYEGVFNVPSNASSVKITFNNTTGNAPVYFDDVRVHPFNANVKSFVYNSSNLRLMSELDENNYAGFYEYDDDGTLTRVKKETQAGVKTITETRSSMQKVVND